MYRNAAIAIALAAALAACADTNAPTTARTGSPSLALSATKVKINETTPIAGVLYNPCNEEAINYTGTVRRSGYVDSTAADRYTKLHITTDLSGTGATTGLLYGIKDKEKEAVFETFDPITSTTTYDQSYTIVSKGGTANFYQKFGYVIDVNGVLTITRLDTRCSK